VTGSRLRREEFSLKKNGQENLYAGKTGTIIE
jgi:hypothetical protein